MSDMLEENGRKRQPLSNRRRSRELALRTLYAYEVDPSERWEVILELIADSGEQASELISGDRVMEYAARLVDTVTKNREAIDTLISQKAANWELRRMAAVDRNVLRLGASELLYFDGEVPYKVVIDEAVEIAKVYGTDDSGKFVNGILDSIRKDVQRKDKE